MQDYIVAERNHIDEQFKLNAELVPDQISCVGKRVENVKQNLQTVNDEVANLKKKKNNVFTNTSSTGNMLSTNCISVNLNFYPGDLKLRPIDYICQWKDSFAPGMPESTKSKIAKHYFDGEALSWANEHINNDMTFSEFEKLFLNQFWSESKQARIKSEFF